MRRERVVLRLPVSDQMGFDSHWLYRLLRRGVDLATIDGTVDFSNLCFEEHHQRSPAVESLKNPCRG